MGHDFPRQIFRQRLAPGTPAGTAGRLCLKVLLFRGVFGNFAGL
jgi:hypothetical protein